MPLVYDLHLVDLDETVADSRFLALERSAAATNRQLRPKLYPRIQQMKAKPGMPEILADIKAEGGQVELLTNSWYEYARCVASRLGLEPHHIEGSAGKPWPTKMLNRVRTFQSCNQGAKIIHIGDSVKDLQASVNAQVSFIMCTWGELNGQVHQVDPSTHRWLVAQVHTPDELRSLLFI